MFLLWSRLLLATTTLPTLTGWCLTGVLLSVAAVFSVCYGTRSGFLRRTAPPPVPICVRLWLTTWVMPALIEEVLFRVLLLPHPAEERPLVFVVTSTLLALVIFVLGHPLRTVLQPTSRNAVFADGRFLLLATVLGAACSLSYLATGSLWPSVVMHQTLVVGWLLFFGGWQKITVSTSRL